MRKKLSLAVALLGVISFPTLNYAESGILHLPVDTLNE
jgi:hypothetical protein